MNQLLLDRLTASLNILQASHSGTVSSASAVKGQVRANFVWLFLQNSIPTRLRISEGGEVIGSSGAQSGELDIVIENGHLPSLTLASPHSGRLFFAESVAFVLEVKSDLQNQWDDVLATATKLAAIDRNLSGTSWAPGEGVVMQLPVIFPANSGFPVLDATPKDQLRHRIPFFAVGYKGWGSVDVLREKVAASNGLINGILQIDRGLFCSDSIFNEVSVAGSPLSLFAFLNCIQEASSYIHAIYTDLIPYAR